MTKSDMHIGGRPVLRLLRALSRPNACVEVDDDAGTVRVLGGSLAALDVVHHASADVWQKALGAGYIEHGVRDGRWRLSPAGRAIVKRLAVGGKGDHGDRSCNGVKGRRGSKQMSAAVAPGPQHAASESPLAWLYRRCDKAGARLISEAQFEAGERLRTDYEIAQLMPRLTVDWQRAASGETRGLPGALRGLEISDRALAARERVSRALGSVGPELAGALVDVCCHLKGLEQLEKAEGWPQRSAKIVLLMGLSALARHYGIGPGAGSGERVAGPARVRHWGADGYRPQTVQTGDDEA